MIRKILFLVVVGLIAGCEVTDRDRWLPRMLIPYSENNQSPLVIDYSYAGYHFGREKPDIRGSGLPVLHVDSLGAVPDDGKDDIDAIQLAVDSAGRMGGGIIRFSRGTYDFDVETEERFVSIRHSNVILMGAGEGPDGTRLYDHHPSDTPVEGKLWLAGQYPSFFAVSPLAPMEEPLPGEGSMKVVANLKKPNDAQDRFTFTGTAPVQGKIYLLTMATPDTSLLSDLIYPLEEAGENYRKMEGAGRYKVRQIVSINEVSGAQVIFDAPVIWPVKDHYELELWEFDVQPVRNCGVLGFLMETAWDEEIWHHRNAEHDNGWDHVRFDHTAHCFAFGLRHRNASTAVVVTNSMNVSVFECRIEGNRGHNGFLIGGYSTRNLFYNLDGATAFHTFGISGYASGNVFHNCIMDEPGSIDCHGGLSVYNLFDNIYGGSWVHGGSRANLPPAHARRLCIWNWRVGMTESYKGRIKQTVGSYREFPGFVMAGVHGLYGQTLYQVNENKELVSEETRGDWGVNIGFNGSQDLPVHSLFLFQRNRLPGDEFIIR